MNEFTNWMASEEDGQGMVEYGLIIALVSVMLIAALTAMQGGLETIFKNITDTLNNAKP